MFDRIFHGIMQSHNAWLVAVFVLYLAFLFIFAAVYDRLHKKNHKRFLFNGDISEEKDKSFRAAEAEKSAELQPIVDALKLLINELIRGPNEFHHSVNYATMKSCSGYRVRLATSLSHMPTGPGAPTPSIKHLLQVYDPAGQELVAQYTDYFGLDFGFVPKTSEMFLLKIMVLLIDFDKQFMGHLEAATSPSPSPSMWSYWDFFYFSTITQSTVGYGDILPNSTVVRMVVVAQILVGYALLIVILNLVFAAAIRK